MKQVMSIPDRITALDENLSHLSEVRTELINSNVPLTVREQATADAINDITASIYLIRDVLERLYMSSHSHGRPA